MMMANRTIYFLLSPLLRRHIPFMGSVSSGFASRGQQLLAEITVPSLDGVKTPMSAPVTRDLLLEKLKAATTAEQVLKLVGSHHSIMNQTHVLEALLSLGSLQKRDLSLKVKQEIIHSPEFLKLSHKLKSHSRALALHETIGVLKAMVLVGVPTTSPVVQILLNLIRHRVNELVPGQIVFVDYLLEKMQQTPLLEALRIALPLIFEAKLYTVISDEDTSPGYLADLLSYASKRKLSEECIQKLLHSLSRPKTQEEIEVRAAQSIICSLCSDKVLSFPIKNSLISRCFENHVNIELLDYVAKNVEASPNILETGSPGLLICLVTGFSLANYKPKNWDVIEDAIFKNENIHSGKLELPWLKFGMELASLGCFSTALLQRIFQEEFLNKFLSREYNLIDQLQLLLLNQAVKTLYPSYVGPYPPEKMIADAAKFNGSNVEHFVLQNALEKGLGGESYVHQGLRTHLGHFIDHVIVMRRGGYPVALNLYPSQDSYIEDLNMPSDSFLIAIVVLSPSCYSANCQRLKGPPSLMIKTLETLNCSVIPLSYALWNGLPDNEKIPYLMQEIRIKCNEHASSEGSTENSCEN